MNIDKVYLDEARRIRVEYLQNLEKINKILPFIEQYKNKIESYKGVIDNIVDNSISDIEKQKKFLEEMTLLNNDLLTLESEMQPLYDKYNKLNDDSIKLKEAIISKYKDITIEEIKNQIIPYISDLQ